jgi:hypothetical protein
MCLRQRLWLSVPPLTLCVVDGILTLAGQSAAYWAGDRSVVHELNPIARLLLAIDPWAFGLGMLGWALAFTALIAGMPQRWALILAFALTVSHSIGACSWLVRHGPLGWLMAIACLAAASELISIFVKEALADAHQAILVPAGDPQQP